MTAGAGEDTGSMRNRTVVVTGGASGIGKATALLLAERGARVGILDRNVDGAADAAREALNHGASAAIGIGCDVGSEHDVQQAFQQAEAQLGPIFGLFANAGIADGGGLLHELEYDAWKRVIDVNLSGVYLACKYALRSLVASHTRGSLVCTSSPTAFVAQAAGGVPAYSASKGGISALVRCLAIDYAPHGIRVNAVVPGATETPLMWGNVSADDVTRLREVTNAEVPAGRLARPEEPARAVVWLLSDDASYVTGSHLVCDGGILAKASISV